MVVRQRGQRNVGPETDCAPETVILIQGCRWQVLGQAAGRWRVRPAPREEEIGGRGSTISGNEPGAAAEALHMSIGAEQLD